MNRDDASTSTSARSFFLCLCLRRPGSHVACACAHAFAFSAVSSCRVRQLACVLFCVIVLRVTRSIVPLYCVLHKVIHVVLIHLVRFPVYFSPAALSHLAASILLQEPRSAHRLETQTQTETQAEAQAETPPHLTPALCTQADMGLATAGRPSTVSSGSTVNPRPTSCQPSPDGSDVMPRCFSFASSGYFSVGCSTPGPRLSSCLPSPAGSDVMGPLSPHFSFASSEFLSLGYESLTSSLCLPQSTRHELMFLLDPPHPKADWRHLAERFGYSQKHITWLEHCKTPSTLMLLHWLEFRDDVSMVALAEALRTLGRDDAAEEVEGALLDACSETTV